MESVFFGTKLKITTESRRYLFGDQSVHESLLTKVHECIIEMEELSKIAAI